MAEKSDHDVLLDIHTYLFGSNGEGGFIKRTDTRLKSLEGSMAWNTRNICIMIGILIGSGIIGASTWAGLA